MRHGGTTRSTPSNDFSGPQLQQLKNDASRFFDACGLDYGPNRVNRLCITWAAGPRLRGFTFADYIATKVQLDVDQRREASRRLGLYKHITYADPTGDTAVHNIEIERRGHV